ncbi:MAG: hypothetical protein ACPIOQ_73925, partial [Promethearchaeia archaeon]
MRAGVFDRKPRAVDLSRICGAIRARQATWGSVLPCVAVPGVGQSWVPPVWTSCDALGHKTGGPS